ncbi:hypothetical protein [Microbacterium aurum]
MDSEYRWDLAITHRGTEVQTFAGEYFTDKERRTLLIAGVGFDPRTCLVAQTLAATATSLHALLVREHRPESDEQLAARAEANLERLTGALPSHELVDIAIYGADNSVVGGRRAALALSAHPLDKYTDLVIDISALSVGISFPIIRFVIDQLTVLPGVNVHVLVAHQPEIDARIVATPTDAVVAVPGFAGRLGLVSGPPAAKLWLPQLSPNRSATLRRIYEHLSPDEVCAIVPFPASHPRAGDALLEDLLHTGGFPWQIDARSIVHADESDPLDLYRTILRLHALREPVFREVGGSHLILSPVGSKVMALGALLAALEKDLPVMYLEDFSYTLAEPLDDSLDPPELLHIWLEGTPYPHDRPRLESTK